jgi:hypothetical protein
MNDQENKEQIKDTFIKSRNGAILRCAGIMIDSGRKDLAKQILDTTKIDRNRFEKIKSQSAF